MRIQSRSEVGVDEVHADRLGLDQHLTGAGAGLRLLDVGQDFGSASFGDFNGIHVTYSNEPPTRY